MRFKCLSFLFVCALMLVGGCGKAVVSGQGNNQGGSGSVGIPFFTSSPAPDQAEMDKAATKIVYRQAVLARLFLRS